MSNEERDYIDLNAPLDNVFNYVVSVGYQGSLILVNDDDEVAKLRFGNRKLIHASFRDRDGLDALRLMKGDMNWRFRFVEDDTDQSVTLDLDYYGYTQLENGYNLSVSMPPSSPDISPDISQDVPGQITSEENRSAEVKDKSAIPGGNRDTSSDPVNFPESTHDENVEVERAVENHLASENPANQSGEFDPAAEAENFALEIDESTINTEFDECEDDVFAAAADSPETGNTDSGSLSETEPFQEATEPESKTDFAEHLISNMDQDDQVISGTGVSEPALEIPETRDQETGNDDEFVSLEDALDAFAKGDSTASDTPAADDDTATEIAATENSVTEDTVPEAPVPESQIPAFLVPDTADTVKDTPDTETPRSDKPVADTPTYSGFYDIIAGRTDPASTDPETVDTSSEPVQPVAQADDNTEDNQPASEDHMSIEDALDAFAKPEDTSSGQPETDDVTIDSDESVQGRTENPVPGDSMVNDDLSSPVSEAQDDDVTSMDVSEFSDNSINSDSEPAPDQTGESPVSTESYDAGFDETGSGDSESKRHLDWSGFSDIIAGQSAASSDPAASNDAPATDEVVEPAAADSEPETVAHADNVDEDSVSLEDALDAFAKPDTAGDDTQEISGTVAEADGTLPNADEKPVTDPVTDSAPVSASDSASYPEAIEIPETPAEPSIDAVSENPETVITESGKPQEADPADAVPGSDSVKSGDDAADNSDAAEPAKVKRRYAQTSFYDIIAGQANTSSYYTRPDRSDTVESGDDAESTFETAGVQDVPSPVDEDSVEDTGVDTGVDIGVDIGTENLDTVDTPVTEQKEEQTEEQAEKQVAEKVEEQVPVTVASEDFAADFPLRKQLEETLAKTFSQDTDILFAILIYNNIVVRTIGMNHGRNIDPEIIQAWEEFLRNSAARMESCASGLRLEAMPETVRQAVIETSSGKALLKSVQNPDIHVLLMMDKHSLPALLVAETEMFIEDLKKHVA